MVPLYDGSLNSACLTTGVYLYPADSCGDTDCTGGSLRSCPVEGRSDKGRVKGDTARRRASGIRNLSNILFFTKFNLLDRISFRKVHFSVGYGVSTNEKKAGLLVLMYESPALYQMS